MSPSTKPRVLFVCTNNSARSQMAEGLLRHLRGDRYEVFSAGTEPTEVNPLAVRAMAERGVDISGRRSKSVDELQGQEFDLVVTVSRPGEGGLPFLPRRGREGPPELPRSRGRRRDRGGSALCLPGREGRDRGLDRGEAGVKSGVCDQL
ncbi:MAG: arsenate reductase ArsC [Methanothrix sp.]|jgi:arsenate reductase|uniref:Protein-tyrosine phosphatase, low molecular weight n=1 Tax=Methanothrix harundinacea TaxID=301375 RepID=A0A117LF29_9EURY|nr:MAG: Protein-tyrosine phosphatase, low molecular weight [Methanothrix harundinacea]KUK94208.1 MAG: Protein-tyrosine phosphatase, low molecular weight [Methanothrix harundinacea]MDD2638643.1 arsenate reductase ArsC [Methanothrix sp.]MDD5769201.1 arsenate reductase ArsC [Methanothrix sp.]